MREKMAGMQAQMEEFVATLNRELVAHRRAPGPEEAHGLIPVINYSRATVAAVFRKSRSQS
jgi:hypothetical protein